MAENYTLTYSSSAQGWPSFYSYFPEFIKGMNQFLYTFKNGNLYQHNAPSVPRNNFYGIQGSSTLTSVFNESALDNKKFKTITLEGDSAWGGTFITDLQTTGFINASYFEQKESDWFAFIRNNTDLPSNTPQLPLRSLTGIGFSDDVVIGVNTATITFVPPSNIGSILSNGDLFYFGVETSPGSGVYNPSLAGEVTSVVKQNNGTSIVTIDTTVAGSVVIPGVNEYFLFIKNSIAESQGVLGHYCEFKLTNTSTSATELFAVKSQAFKSFP